MTLQKDKAYARVAIKCIMEVSTPHDLKTLLREIRMLRSLPHPNLLQLQNLDTLETSDVELKQACSSVRLVTPLYDTNLHAVIRSQELTVEHRAHVICHILRALEYMHGAGVVHRDVKPHNILINTDCSVAIADLGFARHFTRGGLSPPRGPLSSRDGGLTEYVVTRWYRAPELLVSLGTYNEKVDLWSVGCLIGEMLKRKPLLPGHHGLDQLRRVVHLLGLPSDAELDAIPRQPNERNEPNFSRVIRETQTDFAASDGCAFQRRLTAILPTATVLEVDLLARLLVWDPSKRASATEALRHQYTQHVTVNFPPPRLPTPQLDVEFEYTQLGEDKLRQLISDEIRRYHPDPMDIL